MCSVLPSSMGTHISRFGAGNGPSVKISVESPSGERGHSVLLSAVREHSSRAIARVTRTSSSFAPLWRSRDVETASPVASWSCAHHHFLLAFSLVVAVYIQEAWWATEDVLRTSDPAREGLMKVRACKFPWILQNRFQGTVLIIVLIIESSLPL